MCFICLCFFAFYLCLFFCFCLFCFFSFSSTFYSRDAWEISAEDVKNKKKSPTSPIPTNLGQGSPLAPGSKPRSRTQSHLHPLNVHASSSYPNKSPQQIEVSPLRRWSEASVIASAASTQQPPQWQTNFERSYIELEEIGRGRFSVVLRCQEIMSGNEVAVKFINRRKQGEQETLREYKYLSEMKHPNVISALGVFLTSNSYAIVMTL